MPVLGASLSLPPSPQVSEREEREGKVGGRKGVEGREEQSEPGGATGVNHGIEGRRANQVFWEARGDERRSVRVAEEEN